ncbi:hypothetical protein [Methylophilus medardicus]|uniref:Uncharacterized protein n=1 Tax=Methylophilus medardicus TaxID=2588534 RepID=A0A5B8CU45_9PROT|nr:hypothetical protein [Methylophilus medardicus]QDC44773.1 hypothetical protein FIU01_09740 [Methylophilus medardicus]QDC49780.1 hypothetical protein FIU00_09740 [Methylophilus medardicus]QDC53485.1 hypothetical protein FIT99_09740 [Methylophilus medardicus]
MHYPDLSRCAYCYQGLNVRADDEMVEYSEFDYWVFYAIEDLICHLNEWDNVATVDALTKFLRQAISHYANGIGTTFCKQIGLSSWAIKGWLNKGEKPSLPQLLSVCYGLDMFLSDVFLNETQAYEFSGRVLRKLPEKMLDRAERPLLVAAQRIELLETLTKFAEDRNEHRPLSEIAKLLNFTGSCLRYWFPEQCARISSKHADYKRISGIINQESSVNKVKLIVDELKASGVYVSNRKVNNRLLLEGKTLAKPVLYKAFKTMLGNKS